MMICSMFPGQPLSHSGGFPDDKEGTEIADLTLERTGLDISNFRWQGEPASGQVALQVYGAAMSLYRCRILRKTGITPSIAAEHSMGIYPALSAVGAMPEGDSLELTCRVGRTLSAMGGGKERYALGCVTGLSANQVAVLAENNCVYLANCNTSRHFLLSGERHCIEAAMAEAISAGAFSVSSYPTDAPLHTPLVKSISEDLQTIVADYRFVEPSIPLMDHIEQDFLTAAEIPAFLVDELCRPVKWEATYLALRRAGVSSFIEVGTGEALKKYNRWIATEHG